MVLGELGRVFLKEERDIIHEFISQNHQNVQHIHTVLLQRHLFMYFICRQVTREITVFGVYFGLTASKP